MADTYAGDKYPDRSLRDFFYILFRHKWKAILFFIVVMATVAVGTLRASNIYQSEAKLMVRIGRESVTLDPTAAMGQVISVGQSRESEINSELAILRSRELAEKVVDALGPDAFLKKSLENNQNQKAAPHGYFDDFRKKLRQIAAPVGKYLDGIQISPPLADRERALIQFTKGLTIESPKNSNILAITYESESPKLARTAVNKLIDFFMDKHISTHRTPGSYEFFEKEASELRAQLAKVEEELRNLKNKSGVASLDEQRRVILTRLGTLQRDLEETEAALTVSGAKAQALRHDLGTIAPTMVTQKQETVGDLNYGASLMRARLYELHLKEQELLSKYKETSIPVQEIRRQITEAQALLSKEEPARSRQVTEGVNLNHQQIQLALLTEMAAQSSLQAKLKTLKGQLGEAKQDLKHLNDTETRMVSLQRELSLKETKYRKYYESLEQSRIDQALEMKKISNISIVQPATVLMEPVRPRKGLNLILGFILGLLGGVGLAFFSEYLDHSLKTPQDVEEKLQLPLLASIPKLKK